jgi:hypothetical protein
LSACSRHDDRRNQQEAGVGSVDAEAMMGRCNLV